MYDKEHDKSITKIIILISFLLFLYDLSDSIYPCIQGLSKERKMICLTILFLHHFLSAFVTFGFMYNDKRKLVLILAINAAFVLHWKTNDGKCVLTNYVNSECQFDKDQLFNDIWMITGLKEKGREIVLYGLQFSIFMIIIKKLFS